MQPPSETAAAAAGATAHRAMSEGAAHAMSTHRAKGARAKPMMERRTTAIPSPHKEGEAAEESATEQSPPHKKPTAAEQEGKNQDNHDEGQHCNALLSFQVVAFTGAC